jgi:hypothetical protein
MVIAHSHIDRCPVGDHVDARVVDILANVRAV